jgi:hypothetical protein
MRSLPIVAISAVILASCAPVTQPTCETKPNGVRLFVDRNTGDYGDLVEALRRDRNRMVASAPASGGEVGVRPVGPLICKSSHAFPKVVGIAYPPRNAQQIGANLDLYFGEDGQVAVAEFYVIPLAP